MDGRKRVVIEGVSPEIDSGRFAIKRSVGEAVKVEADVFTDGHDAIACAVVYRRAADSDWNEISMQPLGNDRWRCSFHVETLGRYYYSVIGWIDHFASWRRELARRIDADDIKSALLVGRELIEQAARRAETANAQRLQVWIQHIMADTELSARVEASLDEELALLMARHPDRRYASRYDKELMVEVDRERARFGSWYEMFPRSCSEIPGRHGTFADCARRLPYVAAMGFDVLYLPPIHPIGRVNRKGKNNSLTANADDPGSPWAIGAQEGGHKSVHPHLGTLADFDAFVSQVRNHGMEVALDIAYQAAPDHPYVQQHPEWFRVRPDGRMQYAENPPKKYEDIYPFNFESDAWRELWEELKSVIDFWIEHGVSIFRVDNPHTKPFAMWEWIIAEVKRAHPEAIFLAEAFTRPKVMHRLAKLGFSQSYNYFPWRNTKWEITQYMTELTQKRGREYFRPNLWPNTPDILTEYLQFGGRPAFTIRTVLAATLGASYGIYGPAFELAENRPREPGSEEYLDSEKYQIRHWDIERPDSLSGFLARINRIRREHPALQHDWNLQFHNVDNDQLIAYSKNSEDLGDILLMVVNLDPHHIQSGWIELPYEEWGLDPRRPYQVHDLLSDARYLWHGPRNYVELDPTSVAAHVFRLRRRVRTERDFDYYL